MRRHSEFAVCYDKTSCIFFTLLLQLPKPARISMQAIAGPLGLRAQETKDTAPGEEARRKS